MTSRSRDTRDAPRHDLALDPGRPGALALVLVVVALVPVLFSTFFTSQVGLTSLWLGLAAVSLTFLSGYGGMVSLAQTALFGVAGLIAAKLVGRGRVEPVGGGARRDPRGHRRRPALRRGGQRQPGHLLPDHHPGVRRR